MISLSASCNLRFFSCFSSSASSPTSASPVVVVVVKKNPETEASSVSRSVVSGAGLVGSSLLGRGRNLNSSWWRCGFARRSSWNLDLDVDGDGDSELEEEVLEFMKNSENPDSFPSEKQLIDGGREDLAVAISKQGGWLAMGWHLDEDDWEQGNSEDRGDGFPEMVDSVEESYDLGFHEVGSSGVSSISADSSNPASCSGRSLETTNEDDSGIEGILKRLERERNISFGLGLRRKENIPKFKSNVGHNGWLASIITREDHQSTPEVLRKLSDAWEFHENKIMSAHDKLQSIRAKLAVLEGKVALAVLDAKKIVDGKQRRIDDVCKALQLLRTAYIVWTNSGSEVLLVGSYDGWTSKRKMNKTSLDVFTLYLKLYPGKYEIKFIVDGEWKIDSHRPIVYRDGHENNLLIIE